MKTAVLILNILSGTLCCYPPAKQSGSKCGRLQQSLVQRDQWCAREPTGPVDCMWGPVPYVIIHHTVSGACEDGVFCAGEMRKLQKDHMTQKKWPDVGYHYVVGGDSRAYAGRPCSQMGGHTRDHNRRSIGIAFLGDYQKAAPSAQMLELVPQIALCAVEQGYLRPDFLVIGHRDAFCSTCPGKALYQVVGKWPRYPDVVPVPSYVCDSATTTTTTDAATTEPPGSRPEALPAYVYLLLYKKPSPCCVDGKAWKGK